MPNFSFEFEISRVDDRQIVDTVAQSLEGVPWKLTQAAFTFPFGGGSFLCAADELADNPELNEILNHRLELVTHFIYKFAGGAKLAVMRGNQQAQADKLTLNSGQHDAPAQFAKIVASVKRRFDALPPARFVETLSGQGGERPLEAREEALARLEATAAHLLTESEQARKRWEADYRQKEKALLSELRQKTEQHEAEHAKREAQLKAWEGELNRRGQDLGAGTGRHQLIQELKAKLAGRDKTLRLSRGLRWLRRFVSLLTMALVLLFGGAAGYYLLQTFEAPDSRTLALAAVNQAVFLALFVATWVFFIRWHGQWLRRRAAEEFRLKRYELEVDRASWMAEVAFEWKERYGTEIPAELFARLTSNLFADGRDQAGLPPQLAAAALPASGATDHGEAATSDGRALSQSPMGAHELAQQKPK